MTKNDIQDVLNLYANETDKVAETIKCLAHRELKRLENVGRKSVYGNDPKEQHRQRQKKYRERIQQEEAAFRLSRELSQALASDRANGRYNEPKPKRKRNRVIRGRKLRTSKSRG